MQFFVLESANNQGLVCLVNCSCNSVTKLSVYVPEYIQLFYNDGNNFHRSFYQGSPGGWKRSNAELTWKTKNSNFGKRDKENCIVFDLMFKWNFTSARGWLEVS